MRKDKITLQKANELINRYYEGITDKQDEQQIANFLANNPTLKGFEAERAMFSYYQQQKSAMVIKLHPAKKWVSVAATAAIIIIGTLFYTYNKPQGYAFVDGKKITDKEIVRSLAMASFQSVQKETAQPKKELETFQNSNDIVDNQLDIFTDIEL